MNDHGIPDPQWDYALAIRAALELHGRFVTEVDERDAQARVDISWAARQAGRLLGVPVSVEMRPQHGRTDSIVTATVRCADTNPVDRSRAEEGLQRLLESVQEAQHSRCVAGLVPHPRSAARRPARQLSTIPRHVGDARP